jgi:hypothetical protein
MFNRLTQHLKVNKILTSEQFGFRKDRTIENAVFMLTNNILVALNKRRHVTDIFYLK